MSGWIDVKSRLPDDRRDVLVCYFAVLMPGRGSSVTISRCNISRHGYRFDIERDFMFPYRVTYWCDLPGPPEIVPKEAP
jgi:hypothetical protein